MTFPTKEFFGSMTHHKDLNDFVVLHTYRGSVAHGMYVQELSDDKDTMGIVIPDEEYVIGLRDYLGHKGTTEVTTKIGNTLWDSVFYEVHKALNMLTSGNPNIISMLWVDSKYIIKKETAGDMLLEYRKEFLSKKLYNSFVGYAYGQLKRMRVQQTGHRGAKRSDLYDQYGYDPINASHLIRLLRMGVELLATGELFVERPDAPQLLEIKNGGWTLDQVEDEANRLFGLVSEALIHSKLPDNVNREFVNRLCIDMVKATWEERKDQTWESMLLSDR